MRNENLRVGHEERQRYVELLRHHTVEGRLSLDEFGDRVGEVFAARTRGDLVRTLRELPSTPNGSRARRRGLRPDWAFVVRAAVAVAAVLLAVAVILTVIPLIVLAVVIACVAKCHRMGRRRTVHPPVPTTTPRHSPGSPSWARPSPSGHPGHAAASGASS